MGSPTTARARLYDQRYSNSIWLGKLTGYAECVAGGAVTSCTLKHTAIDGTQSNQHAFAENGDVWQVSNTWFGVGGTSDNNAANDATEAVDPGAGGGEVIHHKNAGVTVTIDHGTNAQVATNKAHFAYLKEGKTSVQSSDYFAVGSTIEVMGTTWDDEAVDADVDLEVGIADTADSVLNPSSNKYRKFKVTGHVTNEFNREFAKLDSFPADDGITASTANEDKPDYNLKITSNNGTVHTYPSVAATVTVNEIQIITLGTGQQDQNSATNQIFKLQYKGEETKNMNGASTREEIAEEINSFSQLSGPVTVDGENVHSTASLGFARFKVTFDAKDGDVAQMVPVSTTSGATGTVRVDTRANGWPVEGPVSLGLDTMQAGGIVNITAKEVCSFAVGGTDNGKYTFCYDGNCGGVVGVKTATMVAALESIVDNNGDQVLAGVASTSVATPYEITMPLGKSCDGLEMVDSQGTSPTVTTITKTVNKHNNGKLFRITRSFMQSYDTAATYALADDGGGNNVETYNKDAILCAPSDCMGVVANVDSLVVSQISGCAVIDSAATDPKTYPINRLITPTFTVDGATSLAIGTSLKTGATTFKNDACQYNRTPCHHPRFNAYSKCSQRGVEIA